MSKMKTAMLIATVVAMTAGMSGISQADNTEEAKKACERVATEAKKLPAPSAKSIYEYGKRVVDQGVKCVEKGADAIRGTGEGKGGSQRAD